MLKFIALIILCLGISFEAKAATGRDQAAQQFEKKLNQLNIPNNDYSQHQLLQYTDQYEEEAGQETVGNNENSQSLEENSLSLNPETYDSFSSRDLEQKVKDLEDDIGQMMRQINKLEREIKTLKEKNTKPVKENKKAKKPRKKK